MSSSNSQTCAFCTFINVPGSSKKQKICFICEQSLHLPDPLPKTTLSQVKVCPGCSLFNEKVYDNCKICGTELETYSGIESTSGASGSISICTQEAKLDNASTSQQTTKAYTNIQCSMCRQKFPGNVLIKVCHACTYYSLAETEQCLICTTKYRSNQHAVLSKVCPFCNHDETACLECPNCTFDNLIRDVECAMCGESLRHSTQSEDDNSSYRRIRRKLPKLPESEDLMDMAEDEFSIESMRFEFAEGFSIGNGAVKNMAYAAPNDFASSSRAANKMIPKCEGSFEMWDSVPETHKYFSMKSETNSAKFMRAVATNIEILKTSAPAGVWIRCYEDRLDLLSFMIEGPHRTPYENGLFIFDIHLPPDFPLRPPNAHYISFCGYRLNPNLYVEGTVCVSLLGTWHSERKEEQWTPTSTLLQLIVSIQGLILVEQPWFNDPGVTSQFGTAEGIENSAMYNEIVTTGMISSTTALISDPPPVFKQEIFRHFSQCGAKLYKRLELAVSGMAHPPVRNLERLRFAMEHNVNVQCIR